MDKIYHERQRFELCALHALNNLFQERDCFKKSEFDALCKDLAPEQWINPHRSILGLGNYDVNVIMRALQSQNCDVRWFDKRKDPDTIEMTDNTLGFIMNIPSEYKLGFVTLPLKRRHWYTIRQINRIYYNLDSKLDRPLAIGSSREELIQYLRRELQSNDKELFIVEAASPDNSTESPKICT